MSKRTISFSLTDEEYALIEFEASSRGLTPSQLGKTALFSHMNKYPVKGVMAELNRLLDVTANWAEKTAAQPTFVGSERASERGPG